MRTGLVFTLLLCGSMTFANAQVTPTSGMVVPSGKGFGVRGNVRPETVNQGNGIDYHGGSIMPGTPTVYLIWYGNWRNGPAPSDGPTTVSLVTNFIRNNSGSSYGMINSTYGDTNRDVTGLVKVGPSVKALTY